MGSLLLHMAMLCFGLSGSPTEGLLLSFSVPPPGPAASLTDTQLVARARTNAISRLGYQACGVRWTVLSTWPGGVTLHGLGAAPSDPVGKPHGVECYATVERAGGRVASFHTIHSDPLPITVTPGGATSLARSALVGAAGMPGEMPLLGNPVLDRDRREWTVRFGECDGRHVREWVCQLDAFDGTTLEVTAPRAPLRWPWRAFVPGALASVVLGGWLGLRDRRRDATARAA
jgi:hypothetical protein